MSDFLSKFNKGNYDQEQKEQRQRHESRQEQSPVQGKEESQTQPTPSIENQSSVRTPTQQIREQNKVPLVPNDSPYIIPNGRAKKSSEEEGTLSRRRKEEETEFDPTYKGKQKRKKLLILGLVILGCSIIFFIYYQMTHVKVPDFMNKDVADARTWASENNMKLELEQKYDLKLLLIRWLGKSKKQNQR